MKYIEKIQKKNESERDSVEVYKYPESSDALLFCSEFVRHMTMMITEHFHLHSGNYLTATAL